MKPIILFLLLVLVSFSGIAQTNSAAEEDFIRNNVALRLEGNVTQIQQIGDFNEVHILQDNVQYAELLQRGDYNVIQTEMRGGANSLQVLQEGEQNNYQLQLEGSNNVLGVYQYGHNNVMVQEMDQTDDRRMYLLQRGNDNYLEYRGNDTYQPDLPLQITQHGQGLQLIINPSNHF